MFSVVNSIGLGVSVCFIQSHSAEKMIIACQMFLILSTFYCVLSDVTLIENLTSKILLIVLIF